MKKLLFLSILLLLVHQSFGQRKKIRLAFTPAVNKTIDGIGIGLAMNGSFKQVDSSIINGVSIELIGIGLLPMAGSDFLHERPEEYYKNDDSLEVAIKRYNYPVFKINGVSLSAGGLGGHDINLSGVNISGFNTFIGKTNGFSMCLMFNLSVVLNGVSIGAFNFTVKTRGVQIGLLNGTDHLKGMQIGLLNRTDLYLKGIQIGLWNVNQKRKLPFINWNFD